MCGFGIDLIFKVAIAIIVILVILALINAAFPNFIAGIRANRFWGVIQIVIGGVVAILVLLLVWRLAECSGLLHSWATVGVLPRPWA